MQGLFDYGNTGMTYADVSFNIIYGFLERSVGLQTDKQKKCIEILSNYYHNMTVDVPQYLMSSSMSQLSLTVSYFLNNVDPLAKSCIWSMDETQDLFFPRGYSLDDLWRLLFNMGYRFGNMYDLVSQFVGIFLYSLSQNDYYSKEEWVLIGGIPGAVLSEILYPQAYGDVEIVYPQDY